MSDHWIDRAQNAEAKLGTIQAANDSLKEKLRAVEDNFGIKGSYSGDLKIDFEKLVNSLDPQGKDTLRGLL